MRMDRVIAPGQTYTITIARMDRRANMSVVRFIAHSLQIEYMFFLYPAIITIALGADQFGAVVTL